MGKKEKLLSDRHEREVAELLPGGYTTRASGSKDEKNDVNTVRNGEYFRYSVELKCTQARSFSVTKDLWDLTRQRAYEQSSESRPALGVRFYGPDGKYPGRPSQAVDTEVLVDLVVLELNDFVEILEKIRSLDEGTNRTREVT